MSSEDGPTVSAAPDFLPAGNQTSDSTSMRIALSVAAMS
jgi:hypothetical protein